MPRTSPGDAFVLKNSGLDRFLFAEVGTEQNGSSLTVLSTLARLGKDPWAQAAEWARMTPAAMVVGLTQSIVQMPLCPRALVEAPATAARLVLLLPRQAGNTGQTAKTGQFEGRALNELKIPAWIPMAAFCVIMGLSIVAGTFAAAPPTQAPVVQPAQLGQ